MGWLNAIPDKENKPRFKLFGENSVACDLPSVDSLIASWFEKLGRCSNNGMGQVPISFQEIQSFGQSLRLNLTPWEVEQLSMMSREYCYMQSKGKEPREPSPWNSENYNEIQAIRDKANAKIDEFFK